MSLKAARHVCLLKVTSRVGRAVPRRTNATAAHDPKIPEKVAVPTGVVAGVLGSLCGIGGGVIIIPSLSAFTATTPHAISAASLFCVSISSMTGAASYLEQGFTNLPVALTLMLTSIPGAALGARLAQKVPAPALKKVSGATMLCAAPAIWLNTRQAVGGGGGSGGCSGEAGGEAWRDEARRLNESLAALKARNAVEWILPLREPRRALLDGWRFVVAHGDFAALGFLSGVASGVIGIGGGLVMNTYMGAFTDMPQVSAPSVLLFFKACPIVHGLRSLGTQ